MSNLYVCKEYETLYEEGYQVVRTIEEHNKIIYNQALDDAIEFFMNHIHSNNDDHVVKNYVCGQLEQMKK